MKKNKQTNNENVLNDQKYHKILQNSKTLHTQFKLQSEIFKLEKFTKKGSSQGPRNRDDFFLSSLARDQFHRKLLLTFDLNYSETVEN